MQYNKRRISSFVLSWGIVLAMVLVVSPNHVFAQQNTNVEAYVEDHGQRPPKEPINISHDKTEEFMALYGEHSFSDKFVSESSILILEFLILIFFVGLYHEIKKHKFIIQKPKHKHNK